MHIAIMGTGYVGLVSAACFAQAGHYVSCVDAAKICLLQHAQSRSMSRDLRRSFQAEMPASGLSSHQMRLAQFRHRKSSPWARQAVRVPVMQICPRFLPPSKAFRKPSSPVLSSSPNRLFRSARATRSKPCLASCGPISISMWLRIRNFCAPDLPSATSSGPVVIGAESDRAAAALIGLYRGVGIERARILRTDLRSGELIKYAANGFLATKIAFINEMSDLCEKVNAKICGKREKAKGTNAALAL
jgi:UDPglucose 6-dehydrogenase